jgi:hypothetical protein
MYTRLLHINSSVSLLQHLPTFYVIIVIIAEDDYVSPIPPAPSVPKYVSDAPLPDYLYQLAVHRQPQPPLARELCQGCVKALTTKSKDREQCNGTVKGVALAFVDKKFCTQLNNFGVCNGCKSRHAGGCGLVSLRCRPSGVLRYKLSSGLA